MSRHHNNIAHEINNIVSGVRGIDREDIEQLHGIEIKESGEIFDPTYNMEFDTFFDWATFSVEQDHNDESERYSDETYEL